MRGTLTVEQIDGATARAALPKGTKTLAFWRDYFTASGGTFPGFEGEKVPISLDEWADAPDDTLIRIVIEWVDPKLVGTTDPLGRAG